MIFFQEQHLNKLRKKRFWNWDRGKKNADVALKEKSDKFRKKSDKEISDREDGIKDVRKE